LITSIFIIFVSVVMFTYWFRYTCLLILTAKTPRDCSVSIAKENQMQFITVRTALLENKHAHAEEIYDSLEDDYRTVLHLMRSAQLGSPESALLKVDYWLMSAWYALTRGVAPAHARGALLEMSSIIGYLANALGEQ
jgi:hypothetical protein